MKIKIYLVMSLAIILFVTGCSSENNDSVFTNSSIFSTNSKTFVFSDANWESTIVDLVNLHGDYSDKYDSAYGGLGYVFESIVYEDITGLVRYFYNENDELVSVEFHVATQDEITANESYNTFKSIATEEYGSSSTSVEDDSQKSDNWYRSNGNVGLFNLKVLNTFQIKFTYIHSSISVTEEDMQENNNSELALNEEKLSEKKDYIANYIVLTDFLVEECTGYSGNEPGLKNVSIKNNGGMTIDALELTLDFITDNYKIVDSVSIVVLGLRDSPIKPGYSWSMDSAGFFRIGELSEEVDINRVNIKISDVQLSSPKESDILSEEQEYMYTKLDLLDYRIDYFSTYAGEHAGISDISIKNNGSQDVKSVIVTIYFQDKNENDIAENSFMVIGNIYDGTFVLKANYSWKMEDGKFFSMDNLSSEVDLSRHRVEISKIEFN